MTSWNPAAGDLFPGSLTWSVIGAVAAWLLALLLGASVLRLGRVEDDAPGTRLLPWLIVGISLETSIWLALSWLGALRPAVVVSVAGILGLVGAAVGGRRIVAALRARPKDPQERQADGAPWLRTASWVALGLLMVATLRLALWPTVFYDDLVYHVALPRQALLTGAWPALQGLHYSFMPAGWDAAYLLPMALGGGSGPQLMNVIGLGLFVWATYRLALHGSG